MEKILVIDDDKPYLDMLRRFLSRFGFKVLAAENVEDALKLAARTKPDLIVLDWVLGNGAPIEVSIGRCKADSSTRQAPIAVISGIKENPEDESRAKEMGAALFMTKAEVTAILNDQPIGVRRLKAILSDRIVNMEQTAPYPFWRHSRTVRIRGVLTIDPSSYRIVIGDRVIKEPSNVLFRLLYELALRRGELITRDDLVKRIWNSRVRSHNVDRTVNRLRGLLGDPADSWIESVRGRGYRFNPPTSAGK